MSNFGERYNVTITDAGVRFPGHDWGTGIKPLEIHHRRGDILVLKIPGHNAWQDRLHPSVYEPAAFMVVRDIGRSVHEIDKGVVEFITIFSVRKGAGTW